MADLLSDLSKEYIHSVDAEMKDVLNYGSATSDPFLGMVHYHMGWVDELFAPIDTSSGKRVRPLLCLLCCQAAGGNWSDAVPAGAALEILHNFTLVHDDIQDASPTRRGRATVWKIWGEEQAINVGDAMFALAHIVLGRLQNMGIDSKAVNRALIRLDETCLELTYGQYKDMDFENRDSVSVDEYLDMIGGKTATLISLSSELGALVSGAGDDVIKHYSDFGRDLGLAFQVRDDILGIWGDESLIGKSSATDIETRKKSLPVLFGLEKDSELRKLYSEDSSSGDFVKRAVELLDGVGARAFSEDYENRYAQRALSNMELANPQGAAAEALLQLTNKLLNRQK